MKIAKLHNTSVVWILTFAPYESPHINPEVFWLTRTQARLIVLFWTKGCMGFSFSHTQKSALEAGGDMATARVLSRQINPTRLNQTFSSADRLGGILPNGAQDPHAHPWSLIHTAFLTPSSWNNHINISLFWTIIFYIYQMTSYI